MVGEPFNKRSVPCAFGIKIGLYFHEKGLAKASPFFNLLLTLKPLSF